MPRKKTVESLEAQLAAIQAKTERVLQRGEVRNQKKLNKLQGEIANIKGLAEKIESAVGENGEDESMAETRVRLQKAAGLARRIVKAADRVGSV